MNLASLTLIALLLAACADGPEFATPVTQIPQDCETLAGSVGRPKFKDNDDFRIIAGRYAQRLAHANNKLEATKRCQRNVREGFATQ